MKKRMIGLALVIAMICTMLPQISTRVNAASTYSINGVSVHYADYASSPNECWAYANNFYKKIWGVNFSNSFSESSNSLRNLADTDLTLTVDHLKTYVSNAALGSCLRICNSEYLHGTDGWGHSQIIVQKDSNGFTVFEGGLSASPYCREKYYTWSEYINTGWLGGTYAYIKYIKWPAAPAYSKCSHNYNNLGICQSTCKGEYNWQATYDTSCAGIYEVTKSDGVYLRTEKPYDASTAKSELIPAGTHVEVLGSVKNHYLNEWYKVSYNGIVGYAYYEHLSWVSVSDRIPVATCDEVIGVEGGVRISGWAFDPDTLDESLAIHVYIDDVLAGTCTANLGRPDVDNVYGCGQYHGFSATIPYSASSTGTHSVVVFALNTTYGKEPTGMGPFSVTVSSHTHSYTSEVTTAATCTAAGVRTYTCSGCGDSYTESIAATGHSYGSWTTTQSATCTTTGTQQRKCTKCSATQTLSIAATEHSYGSWVTITEAGCTTSGTQKKTCASCGNVQTQSIPATGHNFQSGRCTACGIGQNFCGNDAYWILDDNGVLMIVGSGDMYDWTESDPAPWYSYQKLINSVAIDYGISSVGDWAFSDCSNLSYIDIPGSVNHIGPYAFRNCESITEITLPRGVASVGANAFYNCNSMTSVMVPDSVTSIDSNAFLNCGSLTGVWVDAGNTAYCNDEKGVLFNKTMTELIYAPDAICGEYFIPVGVMSIARYAFMNCENLVSITIPDSVSSIGSGAFLFCGQLSSVSIGNGVTSIGFETFAHCYSLNSVSIPSSVINIGNCAFDYCNSLTDVTYCGTEAQWDKISIGTYNESLISANRSYHRYTTEVMSSTCGSEGVKTYTCQHCGDQYTEVIPATGNHIYVATITKEATCGSVGIKTYTCSGCSDEYTERIPATGNHNWGDWETWEESSCTEMGYAIRNCLNCIESEMKFLDYSDHNLVTIPGYPATCTEDGLSDGLQCSDCGEIVETQEVIPATGHSWNMATCTTPKTCIRCGATEGTIVDHSYNNGTCSMCGILENHTWTLNDNAGLQITLEEDIYIDLNGFNLSGTIITNGYKVYGMDSTTNAYTCENMGYFNCVDENGNAIVPESLYTTEDMVRYMTIETETGYTFHRFYLGITNVSLAPTVTGFGYKAEFYGDEMMQGKIASIGFNLWLTEDAVVSRSTTFKNVLTLRLKNFDVVNYGETPVNACVTMTLADGTVITGATHSNTLKDAVESVNTSYAVYDQSQLDAVSAMIEANSIMQTWTVENLYKKEIA